MSMKPTNVSMASNDTPDALTTDPIVNEATRRFKRTDEWESDWRTKFVADMKFAEGDSDNGWQWPDNVKNARNLNNKPCLTLNVVRQHNLQIINEARQNKSSVAMRATGGGATKDAADVMEELVRRIEYQSNAQSAYLCALKYQVKAGCGWIRLETDYVDAKSFDQEIYIRQVYDPLSVYMDPDCKEEDCSDARFAVVFGLVPLDEFEQKYPDYVGGSNLQPLGAGAPEDSFSLRGKVRTAEYFRKVATRDVLLSFIDPSDNQRKSLLKSDMPSEVYDELKGSSMTKSRSVETHQIEWKLIAASKIIDESVWAGKYIPLIRVLGEESTVEGQLDRKGHTRAMKDAQRMFNYNASSQVEFVALQSKTPWIASAKAIQGHETVWASANTDNHSVLPFNDSDPDDASRVLPPPSRQDPPQASGGYQQGMETAFNQMMMTSGQYQNQMGMQGNERTGEAINARQEQSDVSVFHFQDNFEAALRYLGKQLIDLIPKIYDTKRVFRMVAEDGFEFDVQVDPAAASVYEHQLDDDGKVIKKIFNPTIGDYGVESDVGAAYGTRRKETIHAMTLLLTQAPALTNVIGDLLLNAMDFKEAQEAAQRLKRLVPPAALGAGPSPDESKLAEQVKQLQAMLAKSLDTAARDKLKLVGKGEMRDIDVYDAETKRMAVFKDMLMQHQEQIHGLVAQLMSDAAATDLTAVQHANTKELQSMTDQSDGAQP